MPCISSCPECHRDLTISDAVSEGGRLRCPHCEVEFAAERALADAVPFPPAAIEVAPGAGDLESSPEGPELAPSAASDQSAADAMATIEDADRGNDEERPTVETESPAPPPASLHVRARPRAKATAFGIAGQLVGMVLGGVLGLALGYYILLWIGGPQADFLEIRDKLPAWMSPPERPPPDVDRPAWRRRGRARRNSDEPRHLGELLIEPKEPARLDGADEAAQSAATTRADAVPASFERPSDPSAAAAALPAEEKIARPEAKSPEPPPPASAAAGEAARPVGPRNFRAYSTDELEAALAKAGAALGCEHCHGTGLVLERTPARAGAARLPAPEPRRVRCSRCRGKANPGISAEAFDRLCELADAVTFAQLTPDGDERLRLRQQILSAVMQVGSSRGKTQIVGRLAGARLEDSQRTSNGIVLAGTVQEATPAGPLYQIKLVLFGIPKSIVVLSQQAPLPPLEKHDRVLILGSIVDSPIKNLAGYAGDAMQVVWGGLPLKLLSAEP